MPRSLNELQVASPCPAKPACTFEERPLNKFEPCMRRNVQYWILLYTEKDEHTVEYTIPYTQKILEAHESRSSTRAKSRAHAISKDLACSSFCIDTTEHTRIIAAGLHHELFNV